MNTRPSSSPAERYEASTARGPWPWLLAGGPAVVVIASLVSAWLAVTRGDPVIAADYYKLGLTINRRLAASPPQIAEPSATIVIGGNGDVRVRMDIAPSTPKRLRLSLRRPGAGDSEQWMNLTKDGAGDWVGRTRDVAPGWRVVTLESDAYRLPVTVVGSLPARLHMGIVASGS